MSDFPNQSSPRPARGTLSNLSRDCPLGELFAVMPGSFNVVATAYTANLISYMPVIVQDPITVTNMVTRVETTGGNLDVGIYNLAGNLLVSSGSTATGAAGIQTFDITDTALSPGIYFLAFGCNSSTAVFRCSNLGTNIMRTMGFRQQTGTFPLPSTATFANASVGMWPVLSATYRSTV